MTRIIYNPDTTRRDEVLKALKENNGYCPCAIFKNDDTRCMCKEFREQTVPGECHCGLYVKLQ